MSFILQILINSIFAGSVYALVASGFSLIYATNKLMHFAHGITITSAAYMFYSFFSLSVPIYLAVILTIIFSGLLGLGMYFIVYLPLQKKKASLVILLIASVAILTILQNIIQLFFGTSAQKVKYFQTIPTYEVFGAIISATQIWSVVLTILIFVGVYLFTKKTKLGLQMRAISDNPELAKIVGIPVRYVVAGSFFIGSAIAGIAGVIISFDQALVPAMGTQYILKGFTGSIIGGVHSIPGSIIGAYIVGFTENFGILVLPGGFKDAISFILLFLFLLFKPNGLFGINKGVKG